MIGEGGWREQDVSEAATVPPQAASEASIPRRLARPPNVAKADAQSARRPLRRRDL